MQILLWRRQQEFRSSSGRWKPHIQIITFKRKIGRSEFNEGRGVVSIFFWNRCRIDWNKAVMCLHPTKTSPLSCFLTIRHCSLLSNVLFGKIFFILWRKRSSKLTAILSESCSYNCVCPRRVSTPSARTGTSTTARCSSPAPSAATGTTTPSARTLSASSTPWTGRCSNQKYIL